MKPIILASSSPFRKTLLQRLQIDFECASPEIDESPLQEEQPQQLTHRLARLKTQALQDEYPVHLIIGSDQSAVFNNELLHKPGNFENAVAQLKKLSGQEVIFYTGLCLLNSSSGQYQLEVVPYRVIFRQLTFKMIENYCAKEEPYQCCGSFKSEGLGITLFDKIIGDDPSTLIGLPLIRLTRMLENEHIVLI